MKKTIEFLQNKKTAGKPITMLTAYDYPTAKLEDEAGIDVVLIGDSVGTNMLGYTSEKEVTLADMAHHTRAVARGVQSAYIISDLPYGTAEEPFAAYENAAFLVEQGADCVKIEGWKEKKSVIANIVSKGIAVCGHIGYNPQTHGSKATVFGKTAEEALDLIDSAKALENAGAVMIVVEKVPQEITSIIDSELKIPVIGIGSGKTDGQVLVVNDILGLAPKVFRHAYKYTDVKTATQQAIASYCRDVESGVFPFENNLTHCDSAEYGKIQKTRNV
ncbi:MAG TPA: 3-methyl-2-oxobutanoate hydroxymethyltransferase [Chitinispirillaceae bacterium]|nr:3-methyl-2-oxobutanoate hydroxymethyltransferase [Chitinispirillaceae bacterium]